MALAEAGPPGKERSLSNTSESSFLRRIQISDELKGLDYH
jgi:hypothetical protein